MFDRMTGAPIRLRLPALISGTFLSCIIAMLIISYIDFRKGNDAHIEALSAAVSNRSINNIQNWFDELIEEVEALAEDRSNQLFLERLENSFATEAAPTLADLREAYIENNPFSLGARDQLEQSTNETRYDAIHAELHSQFRAITKRSQYYDLFFISANGDILYSVFKEDDFGTNLLTGKYASSGLGEVFRDAMSTEAGKVSFADFASYAPSSGAPASFMGKSILNESGDRIGVIAIQLPIEALRENLTTSAILVPEDEIYLLGEDGLARSNSVEPELLSILGQPPDLHHIKAATSGEALHFEDVIGLRGNHVDAFVQSFDVLGNTWKVVVERDLKVALAPLTEFVWHAIAVLVIGAVLSLATGYFLARSVTRPLIDISACIGQLADGDLDAEISTMDRTDEFGQIGQVMNSMRKKLQSAKIASERELRKAAEQELVVEALGNGLTQLAKGNLTTSLETPFAEDYEDLRLNFNGTLETLNGLMRTIAENSNEIFARAEEMSTSADDLSHRTESQAAALEETAATLEELTSSVREAAESASEVETVVTKTRQDAEESGAIVSQAVEAMSLIRKSSTEISQIIGVIDDIAFQTNLLSLNAGVEAARAGDAGRGFAVVASEVRALAQRSSDAAKQIKSLINSSSEQVETGVGLVGRAGESLGSIIERVSDIDGLVSGMASGSREQASALGEINIGISQLDQVTQQNAEMVEEATAAAVTLRNDSAGLTQTVARFKLAHVDQAPAISDDVVDFRASIAPKLAAIKHQSNAPNIALKQLDNDGGWSDF